jgi:glycolate oxidase FAD binding subunit
VGAATLRSTEEIADKVRRAVRPVQATGAGTKPALYDPAAEPISLKEMSALLEYEPSEYTFTAQAGIPLARLASELMHYGQYLPFDPLLVSRGGTLGGCIAAAAHGPGRVRYGGVRDFCLGITFVDASGVVRRGGGKVVKNAAVFDFPKLFCGSLGRLGILTEISVKVFPAPQKRQTLVLQTSNITECVQALTLALRQSWDLEAAEILPKYRLALRLAGYAKALPSRWQAVRDLLPFPAELLTDFEERLFWDDEYDFDWVQASQALVRIPITANQIPLLETFFGAAPHRFSLAGNLAQVAWEEDLAVLDGFLRGHGLGGVVWKKRAGDTLFRLGEITNLDAEIRIKSALDPNGKFPAFPGH